jgi:hypothetical protein
MMEATVPTVVFWFMLTLAGANHPTVYKEPAEDLPACEIEAKALLLKPPHELLLRGGKLSAGCEVSFPKSKEG